MKLVIGNMKMNLTLEEIKNYVGKINYNDSVVICPTSLYVPYFKNCHVGVQNTYYKEKGAYTGEISPMQCASMGIEYTILGHSERRAYFNETDDIINLKIMEALSNNLKVILCVGEKDGEDVEQVLESELSGSLANLVDLSNIIIAYEPIWAIGTGKIPTNEQIMKTTQYIKNLIKEYYETDIKVLYGGSVNKDNIESLNTITNVDGFLVGGASTKVDEFNRIIEVTCK